MLHLHFQNRYIHHRVGEGRITKDVMASVEYNPFTTSPKTVINIATGQNVDSEVEQNLINIKDIFHKALTKSITDPGPKTKIVHLKTFKTKK